MFLSFLVCGGAVAGVVWLQAFPSFFGWLAAVVLGPFASFFANHATVYSFTQQALLVTYTALAVGGLDLIFLLLLYALLNRMIPQQSSRMERLRLTLRCTWKLWTLQIVIGFVIGISLIWNENFSSILLVPPFITSSIPNALYMVAWEITLILFALGFAMDTSRWQALSDGALVFLNYWWVWLAVAVMGFVLTLLPSFFVGENTAAFALLLWGMINHIILFVISLVFFLNRPELFEEEKDVVSATGREDPLPEISRI